MKDTKKLVMGALCLALGILFPSVFHLIGMGGTSFLPMHIPVLVCGFLCGPWIGLIVGVLTPFLTSLFTGMPPLYPIGLAMMIELGTYGLCCGLLTKKCNLYITLITSMVVGRIINGMANLCLLGFAGKAYSFEIFVSATFVNALPGIILQLLLIPPLVYILRKAVQVD